jgi:hypothetical protein
MSDGPQYRLTRDDGLTYIHLVYRLLWSETICLADWERSILGEAFSHPPENAEITAVRDAAIFGIGLLLGERLVENNQNVPLISDDDVELIARIIKEIGILPAGRLIDDRLDQIIRRVLVDLATFTTIAGGGNPYNGVVAVVSAIYDVASQQGVDIAHTVAPENAPQYIEFRGAVFRICLSPDQWRQYGDLYLSTLAPRDDQYQARRAQMFELVRQYFLLRQHEIWG